LHYKFSESGTGKHVMQRWQVICLFLCSFCCGGAGGYFYTPYDPQGAMKQGVVSQPGVTTVNCYGICKNRATPMSVQNKAMQCLLFKIPFAIARMGRLKSNLGSFWQRSTRCACCYKTTTYECSMKLCAGNRCLANSVLLLILSYRRAIRSMATAS